MFGMSVFQSVLERLKAEEVDSEEDGQREPAHLGISGLPSGFVTQTQGNGFAHPDAIANAYSGFLDDEPLPAPSMPAHLARTAPEEIAADLGLAEGNTLADLNEMRRQFARDNHPDRVHPQFIGPATIRMKIANMLIDEAARRLGRG